MWYYQEVGNVGTNYEYIRGSLLTAGTVMKSASEAVRHEMDPWECGNGNGSSVGSDINIGAGGLSRKDSLAVRIACGYTECRIKKLRRTGSPRNLVNESARGDDKVRCVSVRLHV